MTMFLIAALGYLLGRIRIKGISLGTSGVLIVALVFGHFQMEVPAVVRNIGLVVFVTAVGFIAGPQFFGNFRKRAAAYILLGVLVVLSGTAACYLLIRAAGIPADLGVGMMSGALTSTPGLAAAMEATGSDAAAIGYGIAYPFGVVGVVLFVQLVPKLLNVQFPEEAAAPKQEEEQKGAAGEKRVKVDPRGMFAFALAALAGLCIAKIRIPLPGGSSFSLGMAGGPLLAALILAHFGHIGKISVQVPASTSDVLRETGLALFLMGAGTSAGSGFVETLREHGLALFLLGMVMTLVPMILGYLLARKVFKMDLLHSLGAVCGGMTSTPALGTLMGISHSQDGAVAYAATYPSALITVILCCQFLPLLLGA